MKKLTVGLIGTALVIMLSSNAWAQSGLRIDLGGNGFGFSVSDGRSGFSTYSYNNYRPYPYIQILPQPYYSGYYPNRPYLGWGGYSGHQQRHHNHKHWGHHSQVIITKATTMAINEAINGVATVDTIETIIARVAMDANGGDELIVRTGGPMGREIKNLTACQIKSGLRGSSQTLFSLCCRFPQLFSGFFKQFFGSEELTVEFHSLCQMPVRLLIASGFVKNLAHGIVILRVFLLKA